MAGSRLRRYTKLLVSVGSALAVAACGGAPARGPIVIPDTPTASAASSSGTSAPVEQAGGKGLPVAMDIPAIGVHATALEAMGLNKDGSPSTPPTSKPQIMGYYALGSRPCSNGPATVPAVFIGHIDGAVNGVGQRGVLFNLKAIKPGDTVTVGLSDGTRCNYRITKFTSFDKQDLKKQGAASAAAAEIWHPVGGAKGQLRLISCGGKFVGAPLFYKDNLVAFGDLVGS